MLRKQKVIDVKGLSLERDVRILENIHWTVRKGEHWVILGSNGSGKTSLLSVLTGYLVPTDGEIEISGKRYGCDDWHEVRKSIGLVSSVVRQKIENQETALEIVISGKYAMINYWGKVTAADKKKGRGILKKIECGALAERPWLYLSQGERQRVLIGRALMANPKLLILDEPCAGLDPVARDRFLVFLQRLAGGKSSPTLVLVTHHVEEIVSAFTHVLLLRAGKVLAAGGKDRVMKGEVLSRTFGTSVALRYVGGKYELEIGTAGHFVI